MLYLPLFFSFLKFPYHDNAFLKIIISGSEKSSESPPLTKDISGRGIRGDPEMVTNLGSKVILSPEPCVEE